MKINGQMILAWLERHFSDLKVRKGGQEVVMPNPWGDSGAHFNVGLVEKEIKFKSGDKKKGFWVHDWRPGHQQHDGSFIKLVQEFKGVTFFDAIKEITGVKVDPKTWLRENKRAEEEEIPDEIEIKLPDGAKRVDVDNGSVARKAAVGYLAYRCIDLDEAKRYFIHYDSISIIFPYIEFGSVVYWQSRELMNKRFLFPPENIGVVKTDFVYGFDFVEPGGQIIVVESIIDSINIGFGAVAMGGAELSAKQVRKILALNPSQIILGADNDKPDSHGIKVGLNSIWKNYNILKPYFDGKIYYAIPDDPYKDWNDIKKAGLDPRQLIQSSAHHIDLKTAISLRRTK